MMRKVSWIAAAVCAAQLGLSSGRAEEPPKQPKKQAGGKPKPLEPKPRDKIGIVAEPEVEPVGDRAAPVDPPETTRGTTHVRGEEPVRTRGRKLAPKEPEGTATARPNKKKKPAPTYGDPPAK